MKIEMEESLFYSWLRHVKDCQIVQTNWKASPQWELQHQEELEGLYRNIDQDLQEKLGYRVFKNNSSLEQVIRQGECDALGSNIQDGQVSYYAVDVAFHESGVCYGSREETVARIIKKCVRTAFCIYGFFDSKSAEIVFASPKINPAILSDLEPCVLYINRYFAQAGFSFRFRMIGNEDFDQLVLQPILLVSEKVADTSELFMRAYQMFSMFSENREEKNCDRSVRCECSQAESSSFQELKIGKLANTVLRSILESDNLSDEEITLLQTASYSKQFFDIQYPLLVSADEPFERARYYAKPLIIRERTYYLCSQWFEVPANNDRPFLLSWIEKHHENLLLPEQNTDNLRQAVKEFLLAIPFGRVVTYGRIAEQLGDRHLAQTVGNILHEITDERYPCYKVLNSDGKLARHYTLGGIDGQKQRLEAEGIEVIGDRVDLGKYLY